MDPHELEVLCKHRRDQIMHLMEVSDLTKQLTEAVDRNDEVSVNMLLSMREGPIQKLFELEQRLKEYCLQLPEASAIRSRELLEGAEPKGPGEEPLCEKNASYRRLLASVLEDDKQLSLRLGGSKSFYRTFRES